MFTALILNGFMNLLRLVNTASLPSLSRGWKETRRPGKAALLSFLQRIRDPLYFPIHSFPLTLLNHTSFEHQLQNTICGSPWVNLGIGDTLQR